MRTWLTFTSSSAHPVIASEPVTPVVLLAGVSTAPIGAALAPAGRTVSKTGIGSITFDVPAAEMVSRPDVLAKGTAPGTRVTVNAPDPTPPVGATCSHGTVDTTAHVTLPAPACVRRIVCDGVVTVPAIPNASCVRSTVSVGPPGVTVLTTSDA